MNNEIVYDKNRKIIHIDMDAFFAAVEQRDFPELRGKPVVIGGKPNSRGVVSTCSYEARKFGIHSAMPSAFAYRLCPSAIFVRPRFDAYKQASENVMKIFYEYTNKVEQVSIDEAYLDVTENKFNMKSASIIAEEIRKKIKERTGLTASAGVSYNKFLAKIGSDMNKPDGMTIIRPQDAKEVLENLPIRKFHGIGKKTEEKMKEINVFFGRDLKKISLSDMIEKFGKVGFFYYNIVRGKDDREVGKSTKRHSIASESTFAEDIDDLDYMIRHLKRISIKLGESIQKKQLLAKTVSIKIKYADFKQITRSYTSPFPLNGGTDIYEISKRLLINSLEKEKKIRLLGISISNIINKEKEIYQLILPFYNEWTPYENVLRDTSFIDN
jgi:DNA polymerase-4